MATRSIVGGVTIVEGVSRLEWDEAASKGRRAEFSAAMTSGESTRGGGMGGGFPKKASGWWRGRRDWPRRKPVKAMVPITMTQKNGLLDEEDL